MNVRALMREEQSGFTPKHKMSLQLACLLQKITRNFGETRRSSSPSPENNRSVQENKTLEICKETTNGRTGAQYEALIQAERHRELIDIHRMTRQKKSPNKLKN
jgi:hypothetical protein